MLRVSLASGNELACLSAEDFSDVRTLKQHLQSLCGVPCFRQRLLHNGSCLDDDDGLDCPMEVQLVLLPECVPSADDVRELSRAAETGSVQEVERFLNRPTDLHQVTDINIEDFPLWAAVRRGHEDIVRLLLEARADANYHEDILLTASAGGRVEVVQLLLQARASALTGISDPGLHISPVWLAAQRGHMDVVRLLLEAPTGFNQENIVCASENDHAQQ